MPKHTRRKLRWSLAGIAVLVTVILCIPAILVKQFDDSPGTGNSVETESPPEVREKTLLVPVYMSKLGETRKIPLEQYVRGVVAAEMPVEFELEALKAQAIAARTYLLWRLKSGETTVTDTIADQAYTSEEAMREKWGLFHYKRNMEKLTKAVNETQGLILTYNGEPIQATYFSTSNGYTEDSENYWGVKVPYLRSVSSPWDELNSPSFNKETSLSVQEMKKRLGLETTERAPGIKILEKSASGRVLRLQAGDQTMSGRQFRELLGLPSTDFTWAERGDNMIFTTAGYGHGVGMSQWGANGMAQTGAYAEDILKHYYTGAAVESMELAQLQTKNIFLAPGMPMYK